VQILESTIERKFVDRVREEFNIETLKLELRHNAGWPDRLLLIPGGRPLFIEFKRPGEDLGTLQRYRHDVLRELGYEVRTFDRVSSAMLYVRQIMATARVPT